MAVSAFNQGSLYQTSYSNNQTSTLFAYINPNKIQPVEIYQSPKLSNFQNKVSSLGLTPYFENKLTFVDPIDNLPLNFRNDKAALKAHQTNSAEVNQSIQELIKDESSPETIRNLIAENLPQILEKFNSAPYSPKNFNDLHGYGKYLLTGSDNQGFPFCIHIFSIGPNQETPPHDHIGRCVSLIKKGQVREILYVKDSSVSPALTVVDERERFTNDVVAVGPEEEFDIHKISVDKNSKQNAILTHLYYGINGVSKKQESSVNKIYSNN
ncbi:MAG: hypothetical protein V4629_13680 [Pseudomonadota bacterium]